MSTVPPESQNFEWKKSLALQRDGLQSLCGMLNSNSARGTIAFGIAPDGSAVGVEPGNLDKAQISLSQTINQKFDPPIQGHIQVVEIEGKNIVTLTAERNRSVAYHEYDGKAFIREGTTTRQLNLAEKQALQRQRNRDLHPGPWRCSKCGAFVGMLMQMVRTDEGITKSYACGCGGEFMPA